MSEEIEELYYLEKYEGGTALKVCCKGDEKFEELKEIYLWERALNKAFYLHCMV